MEADIYAASEKQYWITIKDITEDEPFSTLRQYRVPKTASSGFRKAPWSTAQSQRRRTTANTRGLKPS
jgi:hypothetical protein